MWWREQEICCFKRCEWDNDLPHPEGGIQILDQSVYFPSINLPYVSTREKEEKLVDNNDSVEE